MKHKVKLAKVQNLKTKAVIFARVSTMEQEQDGQSIESQVQNSESIVKRTILK